MTGPESPISDAPASIPRLGGLLPDGIAVDVVAIADRRDALLPEESGDLARASDRRWHEFSTGRWLARRLVSELGGAPSAIRRTPERRAVWPTGFLGSITHSGRVCAAAVARTTEWAALGLDLEPDEAIKPGLERMICFGRELEWIGAAGDAERGRRGRLVFSAKEAVYKAFSLRTQRVWGFAEVALTIDLEERTFRASLPADAGPAEIFGRIVRSEGWLATAVAWSAAAARAGPQSPRPLSSETAD